MGSKPATAELNRTCEPGKDFRTLGTGNCDCASPDGDVQTFVWRVRLGGGLYLVNGSCAFRTRSRSCGRHGTRVRRKNGERSTPSPPQSAMGARADRLLSRTLRRGGGRWGVGVTAPQPDRRWFRPVCIVVVSDRTLFVMATYKINSKKKLDEKKI